MMHKPDSEPGQPASIQLDAADWPEVLAGYCRQLIADSDRRVLLCVTGPSGTGKSTLGKRMRQEGLPGISPGKIAVIDDGKLRTRLFGLIRREVRFPSSQKDELAPFFPYLKGKRLVVYVNGNPSVRLSRCDVLLRLTCSEETRHQRLLGRNADGEERYQRSLLRDEPPPVPSQYVFELNVE